jgi:sialic acid synthase SpsE
MKIGRWDLDDEPLVIAEIGNNHEGSYALAERLIGLAARAGAGAVKFQTIVPEKLVSATETERIRQLRRFQLSYDEFERLGRVAAANNVLFLSTPFDLESARFLEPLVPAFKIASGDNNFIPLLDTVARTGKPILLSTGLQELAEVRATKEFIEGVWRQGGVRQELAVLHCVVDYPTAPADANLLAIRDLQQLRVTVGYSDHTVGIDAAVLSVALGARVIEKHFTIAKDYSAFRDHQLSADPAELAELVRRVREAARMLGDGRKRPGEKERAAVPKVRRSIVAARDLPGGTVLSWEDLAWVRPGHGLAPGREREILCKALTRPLRKGEMILPEDCREPARR